VLIDIEDIIVIFRIHKFINTCGSWETLRWFSYRRMIGCRQHGIAVLIIGVVVVIDNLIPLAWRYLSEISKSTHIIIIIIIFLRESRVMR